MILSITEIVSSIGSVGRNAGYPTTFIRLHGCNLGCNYCSNKFRTGRKKRMGVQTILSYVFKMGNEYVDICGGEPLLQESMMIIVYDLVERGYKVTIHTNGSQPIDECLYLRSYAYCMEVKCPSSGMEHENIYENFETLIAKDEIKFLIADLKDYIFAKEIIRKYPTKASYIFSPVVYPDGKHIGKDLAQWILEDKLVNTKLGVPIQTLLEIK